MIYLTIFTVGLLTQGLQATCSEGISDIVGDAGARWAVAPHLALRVDAASAGARVDALVPLACFVGRAVRVDHALWSACYVGISKVFGDTLARASVPLPVANCIGSAWGWIARINWLNPWWHWKIQIKLRKFRQLLTCCFSVAIGEGISLIARVTLADGVVVVDRA